MLRPLVLAAALLALHAASAEARIVPGSSVAGVALGATKAGTDARLGASTNQQTGEVLFSRDYATARLTVGFDLETEHVAYLLTRSTAQRDAAGVGPGVTARTMQRRLRGERCGRETYVDDDGSSRDYGTCTVRSGGRTTDYVFGLRSRRVVWVTIERG